MKDADPRPNTLVAIPAYDGRIVAEQAGVLIQCAGLFRNLFVLKGNSNISAARNWVAAWFLESTFDSLFMIDSDQDFTAEQFHAIATDRDADAVIGIYPKKSDDLEPVLHGLGFARVDRCVFERMLQSDTVQIASYRYLGKLVYDFFINGTAANGLWVGEDTGFWSNVVNSGTRVKVRSDVQIGHWGAKCYRLPPLDLHTAANAAMLGKRDE